jgi:predicted nucleic-acid-binding Zn-ribbon protein
MNLPTCPLCGNEEYDREEERTDGRWGMTTHIKTLLVCTRCRYVLTFYDHNSIFDFD